jgi:hypothetical protein
MAGLDMNVRHWQIEEFSKDFLHPMDSLRKLEWLGIGIVAGNIMVQARSIAGWWQTSLIGMYLSPFIMC